MDDLARDLAIAPVEPISVAAELTPSWLQGALRAAGYDVTITGLAVEPIGTGQLSVSLRARFDIATEVSGLPRSVVVKIPAADAGLRSLMSQAYLSEIGFYHELAATVDVDVPACHLVTAAPDGSSFTLILEDMAPATPGDQISGATVGEVAQAIRNLAGLHGPRWGDPTLRESRWLRTQGEAMNASLAEVYPLLLPQVAERLGAALSPEDHATLQEVATVLGAFFKARSHRYSLIHGDYRLDNLLFGPDERVSVVDWQTLAVGLPARDLAYVIGTSLSVADRRAAEGDLVRGYWEDLLRRGVTGYSLAECFDDYRLGMLQCPFISVLGMAWGTPTDRGDAMFAAMISRSCQALRDLGSIALAAAGVLPQGPSLKCPARYEFRQALSSGRATLRCWRTHISGKSDGKGVTSTAKTSSTAKTTPGGGAGETGEAGVLTCGRSLGRGEAEQLVHVGRNYPLDGRRL